MDALGVAHYSLLAFFSLGPVEMMVVAAVAVLLFGSRLPEVARSMGKSVVEFKKGIKGFEEEMNSATRAATSRRPSPPKQITDDSDDRVEAAAPKFEPPQEDASA